MEGEVSNDIELNKDDKIVGDHEKFDQVIESTDLYHEPIQLRRPSKTGDNVDAKDETAPLLPPKTRNVDVVPAFYDPATSVHESEGSVSAGSVLTADIEKKNQDMHGDKDISIHDLLRKPEVQVHKTIQSESIKAFFGANDTVDAGRESGPSYEYNMKHKSRGCFLIFNHMHFQSHLGVGSRKGTHEDAKNLEKTAQKLGFEYVRIFDDLNAKDIMSWVLKVSKANHSNYDCFAMAILTHGDEGDILYARDAKYHLDNITEPFMATNCPSLARKPKMFFIQACRGVKLDDGARTGGDTVDARITNVANKQEQESMIIPNAADFLLAFSTVPGYYAWRNQACGSWFIQALCKCLLEFGDRLELMQIMTRVNRMVAYDFTSYSKANLNFHGKKQIPSIVTRLTHEVFFRKKGQRSPSPPRQQRHRLPATEVKQSTDGRRERPRNENNNAQGLKGLKETDL